MRIDYITFTVFGFEDRDIGSFWAEFTGGKLGKLITKDFGGRGFRSIAFAEAGAKVYSVPITKSKRGNYFSVELPGKACSCLTPDDFQKLYFWKQGGVELRITRIDYAFDDCKFTPKQFHDALITERVITVSSRSSISYVSSPYQKREDGEIGCDTAYLGSASSDRRVRVYNLHGFTRTEFQLRATWADTLGWLLLAADYITWKGVALSHLQDYVRILEEWWADFVLDNAPSEIKIYSARKVSFERMEKWLSKQVTPALFAYISVIGAYEFWEFVVRNIEAKPERLKRYEAVMQLSSQ